jgi:hypothetical protein
MEWLVEHGADVTVVDNDGDHSLHFAAENGHLDAMDWLVNKGVSVAAVSHDGRTAIHFAAENGHLHAVRWLVEHGADVTAVNNKSSTALHFAAINGSVDMIKWLLAKGLDVATVNECGVCTRKIASAHGQTDAVTWLNHYYQQHEANARASILLSEANEYVLQSETLEEDQAKQQALLKAKEGVRLALVLVKEGELARDLAALEERVKEALQETQGGVSSVLVARGSTPHALLVVPPRPAAAGCSTDVWAFIVHSSDQTSN